MEREQLARIIIDGVREGVNDRTWFDLSDSEAANIDGPVDFLKVADYVQAYLNNDRPEGER